jgi:protein-tyrosine phosphatase
VSLPDALTSEPSRRISLAGAVNFRDLGGYPTGDGRRVRWRRVFRSDSLCPITESDARHLVEDLGLATVVDLRSSKELREDGRGALEAAALSYHHLPLFEVIPGQKRVWPGSLHELYAGMLRDAAAQVGRVLHVIATADAHPVVFHCVAGKDRTGVIAAVLLGLLGVGEDDIVADYVMTQEVMPTMRQRWATSRGPDTEFPEHVLRAEEATMRRLLDVLQAEHGGIRAYAARCGVGDEVVASLQDSLLVSLAANETC